MRDGRAIYCIRTSKTTYSMLNDVITTKGPDHKTDRQLARRGARRSSPEDYGRDSVRAPLRQSDGWR